MASNENTPETNDTAGDTGTPATPENAASTAASTSDAPAAGAKVPSTPPPAPPPPDPLAVMTAERDKLKDALLRSLADFNNFRKRSFKEKQDATVAGRVDVLREMLPVFDNLDRASGFAKTGADAKAIADGLGMVLRLFDDTLSRLGGKRIKTVGEPFDPNVHEAIQQVESEEHAAGLVATELVAGYQLGERLLRAAMVAVSKGAPPKPAATEAAPEAAPAADAAPAATDDTTAN